MTDLRDAQLMLATAAKWATARDHRWTWDIVDELSNCVQIKCGCCKAERIRIYLLLRYELSWRPWGSWCVELECFPKVMSKAFPANLDIGLFPSERVFMNGNCPGQVIQAGVA